MLCNRNAAGSVIPPSCIALRSGVLFTHGASIGGLVGKCTRNMPCRNSVPSAVPRNVTHSTGANRLHVGFLRSCCDSAIGKRFGNVCNARTRSVVGTSCHIARANSLRISGAAIYAPRGFTRGHPGAPHILCACNVQVMTKDEVRLLVTVVLVCQRFNKHIAIANNSASDLGVDYTTSIDSARLLSTLGPLRSTVGGTVSGAVQHIQGATPSVTSALGRINRFRIRSYNSNAAHCTRRVRL